MGNKMEKLKSANKYINENMLDEANDILIQILNNNPNHKEALALLAKVYARKGQPGKSLEYADKVLKLDNDHPEANSIKGYSLLRKNEVKSALTYLVKAYEIDKSQNYRLLNNIALAYSKLGEYEKAEQFINEGLRLKPNSDSLNYLLALVYKRKKKPRNIFLEQLKKVKRINPIFKAGSISINQILFVNKYIRFPFEEIIILTLIIVALFASEIIAIIALLTLVLFFGYLLFFYRQNKILVLILGSFAFLTVLLIFARLINLQG